MTIMCRLRTNNTFNGKAKIVSTYVVKRLQGGLADREISMTASPAASQSDSAPRKQPVQEIATKFSRWEKYQPFSKMMTLRREEADRSLLIEVENAEDSGPLKKYCENYGPVNKCYMYKTSGKKFILLELKNVETKTHVMESAFHSKDPQSIPVTSPCLFFRHHRGTKLEPAIPDSTIDTTCNEENILEQLQSLQCNSNERLKSEMNFVHQKSKISDLSIRLRFITCNQIDMALSGLFVGVKALPFGSSISGFGRSSGDLDIFLDFKRNLCKMKENKPQLFFHSKAWLKDKNLQLKVIGDMISILLPGCSKVMSILSARVPIIKYHQTISNLDCDLQNSSVSGVDLSHIMWIMHHWDNRVAPLVYTLRIWASHNNVVGARKPGPFITNFSLVMMVIFFLQNERILPSLQMLNNMSDKSSTASLDPDSDLVFPDLRKISNDIWEHNTNNEDVDTLLVKFFKFYSNFNFEIDKLSVYRGEITTKTGFGPLEIENPIDPSLNIARNVTRDALQVFKRAALEANCTLGENYQSMSLGRILRTKGARPSKQKNKDR